jgi:hypothetical protein
LCGVWLNLVINLYDLHVHVIVSASVKWSSERTVSHEKLRSLSDR